MELTNIHPAEAYLRNEQNPSFLYIRIYGERRKLFINRGGENAIGIIAKGKRKRGYIFTDWDNIEKIYTPSQDNEKDRNRKLLLKYQRLARLATHTNNWLRKIAVADPEKSLYENHITTGTVIDGMCISLARIEKYCGSTSMALFRKALKDGKIFSRYSSPAPSESRPVFRCAEAVTDKVNTATAKASSLFLVLPLFFNASLIISNS